MRLAILDDYQNVALKFADWSAVSAKADITVFDHHVADPARVATRLKPFDILVVMRERTPFPRAMFEALPNLKLLVTTGMRNAAVDLKAATDCGIIVCGTAGGGGTYSIATVEMTWGLILAVARNIPAHDRSVREGGWQLPLGTEIYGKTLGVVGLGKLGEQVARIGQAFHMNVIAWSQNLTAERCAAVGVRYVSKEELLSTADFVSIHLVLSERTRGLVGAKEIAAMKPSAFLINTSRGPIVDNAALRQALEAGKIRGAGLDVFDVEPLPVGDPMRTLPRTVLSPHLGYVTDDNYRIFYAQCAEGVAAWLAGKPVRVLNQEVLAQSQAAARRA
jgi:phosphoglycerate dehydrogenase-like enzyme